MSEGDPGNRGHWSITRGERSGTYQLSIEGEIRDWFLYMDDTLDGNLRGKDGDPGPEGEWYFAKL